MDLMPLDTYDRATAEQLVRDLNVGGWARTRPFAIFHLLISAAIRRRPLTPEETARSLDPGQDGGQLASPCWETPEPFTEQEAVEFSAEFNDRPARTADELNAEEAARHRRLLTATRRYAAHYGMELPRTCGDVLELLLRARMIHRHDNGHVSLMAPVRPVEDVFPVTAQERAELALMRATMPELDQH